MPHTNDTYDCIVVGTGGVGSAALYHLALRGARALGLDRFPPGHDRGSSHGKTRMIRQAYFEHPDYVPLVLRSYELWAELSRRCGQELYREVGLIEAGPPRGVLIPGVLDAARRHNLEVEKLSPGEVERRFPGLAIPRSMEAVFECRAGYLLVEECVLAHLEQAVKLGARLKTGETVLRWRPEGDGVVVETDRASYHAGGVIITAGPWAADLLAELGLQLEVRRKPLFWYRPTSEVYRAEGGFPGFFFETPAGLFYGFPQVDDRGLKVAEHSSGDVVVDPLRVDRSLRREDQEPVEAFLRNHLPGVSMECLHHQVCLYTMSPDEHFRVDRHPEHHQVALAAGLSGHGFKFTCVLGEALTQLVLDGQTPLPIRFLSIGKPK